MTTTRWWRMNSAALAESLTTDLAAGLTSGEARRRLEASGPNKLAEGKGRTPLGIFFEQFADFMIWVLIGAALVSGFLKEWVDAAAIVAIVVLNAVLGFIQEHRAERSLQALRRMASPTAKALRDGAKTALPACDLVSGDVIELEAGDHVPADSRVISHTANFAVQEAGLTGESTPVLKTQAALEEDDLPLGDRANMIYMGTAVVAGKARAVVVETGMKTELGKIAGMIQDIGREQTPLQKRLEQFGKFIIIACFVLVGLVFVMGLLRGGKLLEMFLTAVSLAVAAIPEGMPAVVTIALALGVQRMVRRHVLIRKLPAVETLGCVTVICSDKTGTLTKNEMTVRAVVTVRAVLSSRRRRLRAERRIRGRRPDGRSRRRSRFDGGASRRRAVQRGRAGRSRRPLQDRGRPDRRRAPGLRRQSRPAQSRAGVRGALPGRNPLRLRAQAHDASCAVRAPA